VLKKSIRKVSDSVNLIVEHDFEEVTYKTSDGRIVTTYFPVADDKESHIYDERVQGTHATGNLLSTLAFNRYQMATPAYREMSRMVEMKMSVCRQTLINWYGKIADKLNNLIPAMKDEALQPGANVNVDETWCRYQTRFGHKKHYMWCLANKAAKMVIFFYDEGKRSRNVLREFLGDAKIQSLQSDGYNVYMYLDNELNDMEHLCCMAHVRAKFKYALEQGMDKRAQFFIDKIGWLYNQEKRYRAEHLTAEEIKIERNSERMNLEIAEIRKKLDYYLYFDQSPQGDLMRKALNYMNTFWEQLFRYRNDGNYSIDNSLAERCIRPMALERKNSLFFCSTEGAKTSAIFHTIIETCKQLGVSAREYIKKFLDEVSSGRSDWENLTPSRLAIV
jgi:elongation factor P hydroxylase